MSFLHQIERLLREKIGLDLESIGAGSLRRAVERRMEATGESELHSYMHWLLQSNLEADALVEELVVPETWFFRDPEAFVFLVEHVQSHTAKDAGSFEVLSAPCSTGEEAYSVAMALLDGGIGKFGVTGWDVSVDAIRQAEAGLYNKRSFRSDFPGRDRYFTQTPSGERKTEAVLDRHVQFERRNLLEPPPSRRFDAIFCRNLFIYLSLEGRERLIGYLRGMLGEGAPILVAPSEQQLMREAGLQAIPFPGAYAFREPVRSAQPVAKNEPVKRSALRIPIAPLRRAVPPQSRRIRLPHTAPVAKVQPSLEEARRLADAAKLEEAWQMCLELERTQGASGELFYLKGLVCDAQGNDRQAADLYGRAVYLSPDNPEALAHLALAKERLGDSAAAGRLRARVRRLMETAEQKGER